MIEYVKKTAKEAGKELMKYYEIPSSSYKKALDDRKATATEAERMSKKIISDAIHKKFPNHEVYGKGETKKSQDSDYLWYIDPLDGSTNFSRKIPLFGLSIGLIYKGFPILGVLYFPKLKLIIYGEKGKGAYVNNHKKVKVSSRSLEESLYYISTAETRGGWSFPSLKDQVGWIRAIDASSYEFAQIAMGDADLYTSKNAYFCDIVAGAIIVEEAGGKVTDEKGGKWSVSSNVMITSNGAEHEKIISLIQKDLKQ